MAEPVIRLASGEVDRAAAFGVRHEVFVGEQGVPAEIERDELDATADHAVAFDAGGRCVGAGRLVVRGDTGVVGRMAVAAGARNRGVGAAVLACLEDAARARGLARIELNAQAAAVDFYLRNGYEQSGEPFEEVGIAHVPMNKVL